MNDLFDTTEKKKINISNKILNPLNEAAAYEILWSNRSSNFKNLAEILKKELKVLPSSLVSTELIESFKKDLIQFLNSETNSYDINILLNSTLDYPEGLLDAKDIVQLLYYSGDIDLLSTKCISIVGTRNPTKDGITRASNMVKRLVNDKFTIVSGLAKGIDTVAHHTAILNNGNTIAVIGTPINQFYPKENKSLQTYIAKKHLLISQVPFLRYSQQTIHGNKLFFPERNKTMSALSLATIIIEAGETSGTLIQARAALEQGRKLFILNSCFENPNITWPARFEKIGAIRVRNYEDVINNL